MSITYDNNHYKSKSFIAQLVNIYMCFKKNYSSLNPFSPNDIKKKKKNKTTKP